MSQYFKLDPCIFLIDLSIKLSRSILTDGDVWCPPVLIEPFRHF